MEVVRYDFLFIAVLFYLFGVFVGDLSYGVGIRWLAWLVNQSLVPARFQSPPPPPLPAPAPLA